MNFEKILLVLWTNYVTKLNNPNQIPSNQFHHSNSSPPVQHQDTRLYIELKKQTSKVWSYLLKT